MRKHLLALVMILGSWIYGNAQYVLIPDSMFRVRLVNEGYGSCVNGNYLDTTCPLVVNTVFLNLTDAGIRDLEGIQYFNNLSILECSGNELTSLPIFPNSLTELFCLENYLTSLPLLPTSLKKLDCGYNL
jgi:hypothetical protein